MGNIHNLERKFVYFGVNGEDSEKQVKHYTETLNELLDNFTIKMEGSPSVYLYTGSLANESLSLQPKNQDNSKIFSISIKGNGQILETNLKGTAKLKSPNFEYDVFSHKG